MFVAVFVVYVSRIDFFVCPWWVKLTLFSHLVIDQGLDEFVQVLTLMAKQCFKLLIQCFKLRCICFIFSLIKKNKTTLRCLRVTIHCTKFTN